MEDFYGKKMPENRIEKKNILRIIFLNNFSASEIFSGCKYCLTQDFFGKRPAAKASEASLALQDSHQPQDSKIQFEFPALFTILACQNRVKWCENMYNERSERSEQNERSKQNDIFNIWIFAQN